MTTTSSPALTQQESLGKRLQNGAVGILFALVLLIPRLLHLRRNPRSWRLFCIVLGIGGAAFVILPLGLGNSYFFALVGMVMFIAAILLPPAKPVLRADDKARQRAHEARCRVRIDLARAERGDEVPGDVERREDVVRIASSSAMRARPASPCSTLTFSRSSSFLSLRSHRPARKSPANIGLFA